MFALVKLFSRKKKQEEDALDVLREAFTGSNPPEGSTLTPKEASPNDPQISITKTLTVQETTEPLKENLGESAFASPQVSEEIVRDADLDALQKVARMLHILMGKEEITKQLKPLVNPENLQTMTRLNDEQVDFVMDAHWFANQWKVFEPLRDFANELCETMVSSKGKGRQEVINYMGALTGGKLLKGLTISTEAPKQSRLPFRKGKEEEAEGEQ